jgi:hypothetical protein
VPSAEQPLVLEQYISCDFGRHGLGANAWLCLGRHFQLFTSPQGLETAVRVVADYSTWQERADMNKPSYPIE